jgi:uncharacterized protein (DUF1330 family)
MPVYFVIYLIVTDPARFEEYYKTVMPVIERRGGRLVAKGVPETLEGHLSWQQAVVFRWPSRQALLEYWHSDEYAQIKKLREGASEWQAIVVDSVSPE